MTIKTICVCGAGTMGSGIAQVSAQAGFDTILYELNEATLVQARASIQNNLATLVEKGKLDAQVKDQILQRIRFVNDIRSCVADLFIEAIIEKIEAKVSLFNQLAAFNDSESIFASNTSSLSITGIAQQVNNPSGVIGLHFFNPAPLMKLVEVINTQYTDLPTTEMICEVVRVMGKTPVICKDSPGFIVNRVARPYYIESLRLVEAGVASFEKIDSVMESIGFRMGPFRLMDLIGNDVNYAVSCSVYDQLGQPERLKPSTIQKERVEKGEWGRKAGKGYYDYNAG